MSAKTSSPYGTIDSNSWAAFSEALVHRRPEPETIVHVRTASEYFACYPSPGPDVADRDQPGPLVVEQLGPLRATDVWQPERVVQGCRR